MILETASITTRKKMAPSTVPGTVPTPPASYIFDGFCAASRIDFETFVKTLRSAPRGGATDVLGIAYELVQGFLENSSRLRCLFRYCDAIATVRFSEPVYELLAL